MKLRLALLAAGSSIHTTRWANALAARGHDVHLITQHRTSPELSRDVRVWRLPIPGKVGYFLNAPVVRRWLRQLRPDLIHAHYASGYGTLGRLSAFHPYVLSVWGSDVYDFPLRSGLRRRLLRGNLLAADVITSTSEAMAREIRALGADLAPIQIIPFGVDTRVFTPRTRATGTGLLSVGTVKALDPAYGIDTLIEGFALARTALADRHPATAAQLRLLIVGGGQDRRMLQRLARSLEVREATEFIGPVPHSAVPEYLSRLDIYVAVSRQESFGVAVLEASACALPVIVSDAGGLPEVVEDGVTGKIVRRDDPCALSRAIQDLALDPVLRIRMGDAGRHKVTSSFEWNASVSKIEDLYRSICR